MDDIDHLQMYQDVMTAEIREAAINVTTTDSVVEGSAMTTFAFDLDMRALGERMLDEIPANMNDDPFLGRMEVTIDAAGLVWRWNFLLDEAASRDAFTATGGVMIGLGAEIVSINQPVDVALPTEYVDVISEE